MKYKYTWNHLKLFAQICGYSSETSSNIGENWIEILENQQEIVFPFTLWPLTYRTSALMASPAVFSPTISKLKTHSCEMNVKFYRSNEVILVCFIHKNTIQDDCNELCLFDTMCDNVEHMTHISNAKLDDTLVNCGMLTTYKNLKNKIIKQLNKCRSQTTESDVSCIICIGYGKGASMANFMSMDLSMEFKELQEFMDEDNEIIVDCVTFSSPPTLGNDKFWVDLESMIDGHIDVQHINLTDENTRKNSIIIGDHDEETVLMGRGQRGKNISINTYISEIDKKIKII